jgi:hypothetical protein
MTLTDIPRSEADMLALATGLRAADVQRHLARLSELERSVLEWRAPIAGQSVSDREIARRLGIPRKQVQRVAEIATGKLCHPAFAELASAVRTAA